MKKIVLLTIVLLFTFTGCYNKVEVPVYVYNKTPILNNYDVETKYDFGTLVNKNNNVCIERWNACIPKNEFIILVDYLKDNKSIITKHNDQINIYNIWSENNNNKK